MTVRSLCKSSFNRLLSFVVHPLLGFYSLKRRVFEDGKVPILTYHKITDVEEGIDASWNVSPSAFERQMSFLYRKGFTVIPLETFYRYHRERKKMPRSAVIITFDDGYASFYRHALPVLERYRFPVTMFLTGDHTGNGRVYWWDEAPLRRIPTLFEDVRTLLWSEIEDTRRCGLVSYGSHTMSHPHLDRLPADRIEYELVASKKLLEDRIGGTVSFFSYPGGIKRYGDLSKETTHLVKEAGYRLACTSEIGRNGLDEDLYMLKRIGIGREDSMPVFKAKLIGACDWLGTAQKTFQCLFGNIS